MVAGSAALLSAFTEAIARRDFAVPAYPATALRLRRLIASDRYSVPQLSEIVASDPALAATVLSMANSPLYRPEGAPITALGRAVHRIGVRSLGTLATAAGVGAQACARGPLVDLKYTVWRRALTCALISQKLAPARSLDPEEAFLAGLLHGFGRTVAVACLEKLLGTNAPPRPLTTAEWLALTEEHRSVLAKAVAERWELPTELAAAIGASPDSSSALAQLILLSEELSQAIEHNTDLELPRLSDQEKRLFRELCALLPGAISALVEAPDNNRPPPPSAIAKPPTALKGEVREVALDVTDARAAKSAVLATTAISGDGLRLKSDRPFQEGCLVHLRIARAENPLLSIWANVLLCVPDPGGFRVEVQLFTPSRDLRAEWLALFESARAAH